ncbi:site-specific DNA-methyltransferase [Bacteroidales bacterium OttesenSCG-928-M11]|nr:site-specific DNA-methyltransferase [Bacteroidales bacterium OttesenSCG-928-M11]
MIKEKSPRNKTIELSEDEASLFSERLLIPTTSLRKEDIINKTIQGDLFDVINYLPKQFADLIIIDPPYNLTKDFANLRFRKKTDDGYLQYLESWFPQVISLLKPNGSVYICGDWGSTASLYTIMDKYLNVLSRITWQREKGKGGNLNWKNAMEDIWFGVNNQKDYYFDLDSVKIRRKVIAPYKENGKPKDWEDTPDGKYRMTRPSNFWDDITIPFWSMPENTQHPTQKPEKLIAKLILASCPKDGVVFDPFLGSGTSSVVAKKLGRKYCGVELDPTYACIAEKRLSLAENNKDIQGYSNGTFWERNSL